MAMGTKPSFNILLNFNLMTLFSQLGHYCICFIALKRNQLGGHKFCLNLNPKMHSSNKSCKEVFVVRMF
jgi:hypothetical protein